MTLRKFLGLVCGGLFLAPRLSSAQATGASPAPQPNASAGEIESITFQGNDFYVRRVNPHKEALRIFLNDSTGKPLRTFQALSNFLETRHETLLFAANAGMFEEDRSTVGLLIENGQILRALNTRNAHGNFYLKPNGVFFMDRNHNAHVVETSLFRHQEHSALLATQSGPLLVQKGKIHPAFKKDSINQLVRSGVGVTAEGEVVFILSKGSINFYSFAEYFQELGCPDALFLDGSISAFYSPTQEMPQPMEDFGPMLAIVGTRT